MKKITKKDLRGLALAMGARERDCILHFMPGALLVPTPIWLPSENICHAMMVLKALVHKGDVKISYSFTTKKGGGKLETFICYTYAIKGKGSTLPEAITRLALNFIEHR